MSSGFGVRNWGLPKCVHFKCTLHRSVLIVLLRWGFACCVGVCVDDSASLRVANDVDGQTDRKRGGALILKL